MKTINPIKTVVILILVLCFAIPAFAEGTKGGNGAEIVYIDGRPVLRDRIDDTTVTCYLENKLIMHPPK